MKAIDRHAKEFLRDFIRTDTGTIALDSQKAEHRLVQRIKNGFVLKRSPKPAAQIVAAYQMFPQSVKRPKLLRSIVREFNTLDTYRRHYNLGPATSARICRFMILLARFCTMQRGFVGCSEPNGLRSNSILGTY